MGTWSDIRDQRYQTEPDIGTSDIGLREWSPTLYRISESSFIRYPTSKYTQTVSVAQCYSACLPIRGAWVCICRMKYFFLQCRISEWALMSISEHFRYRNDVFQSDIFVSDIGITDVDVGYRWHWGRCRCPPMVKCPCPWVMSVLIIMSMIIFFYK